MVYMPVELERGPTTFVLVLVAQPQDLDNLMKGKNYLQKLLAINPNAQRLSNLMDFHNITGTDMKFSPNIQNPYRLLLTPSAEIKRRNRKLAFHVSIHNCTNATVEASLFWSGWTR